MTFEHLNLSQASLDTLKDLGFEEPTPIQAAALPLALSGRDLIGQAQTGTGKTAAFGLALLEKLDPQQDRPQALVVAPTRELAIQVQEEIYRLGKGQRARVLAVYGGAPIGGQVQRLQKNKPQIVVGTPGRLLDLIRRGKLDLSQLTSLVLDEADEMLNMGFIEDIQAIVQATPPSRQTLMFSATLPREVKGLAHSFMDQPETVKIQAKTVTADLIDQYFSKCRDDEKFDILCRFLEVHQPQQAIIFCRTKKRVDEVGRGLSMRGFDAELIHGDISQQKRTQVIKDFKNQQIQLLVATDVAARGLDITGVSHVYNYDIPQDPESYVHRIGRTGRAGQEGLSLTLVQPSEMAYLRAIEGMTQVKMTPMRPPTLQEARQGQLQVLVDQVNRHLEEEDLAPLRNPAKQLLNHYAANDLVAGLLYELLYSRQDVPVDISPQAPLASSRKSGKKKHQGRGGRSKTRSKKQGQKPGQSATKIRSQGRSGKASFKMRRKGRS